MTTRFWLGMTSLGVLLACVGCATPYKRAAIPAGEWSGRGRFVCARPASEKAAESAGLQTSEGTYPTRLKIEPVPGGHVDSRRLQILSQRGRIENLEHLGDRTHLIARLDHVHRSSDDQIALYRLAEVGVSVVDESPRMEKGPGPAHASCAVVDADLVLRIHYNAGFVDMFRFRGDLLSKEGSYSGEIDQGFIHWSEQLRRQR